MKSTIESMEETLNQINNRRKTRQSVISSAVDSPSSKRRIARERSPKGNKQRTTTKERNQASSLKRKKLVSSNKASKTNFSRAGGNVRTRRKGQATIGRRTAKREVAKDEQKSAPSKAAKVKGHHDGGDNTRASENVRSTRTASLLNGIEGVRKGKKALKARLDETRKRREKLEKERLEHLEGNSGLMRQKRLKQRSLEEKLKLKSVNYWLISVVLGARVQSAIDMVVNFRDYKRQLELEDTSARMITRQMRVYRFRRYRKRVQVAMLVITRAFLVKIRLWRKSRRRVAHDRIRAFLLALEEEARTSGGCLALIVKGKKWRAYRIKIINLQRLWRGRLSITAAQSLLIDLQWQREQESRTYRLVERLFEEGAEKATIENERIDNINRTRKLIKLKSLPKIRNDTRHEIRERLMKGTDLLSADHICPTIFRAEIIGEFLRYLRRFHLDRVKQYNQAKMRYGKIIKEAQLRRAVLIRFSGNQSSGRSVFDTEQEPVRPYVRVILRKRCLDILLSIGADYVESVRHAWMPKTMKINPFCFDGVKEAALVQINDTCRVQSEMV